MKRRNVEKRAEEMLLDLPEPAAELGGVLHLNRGSGCCWIGGALPIENGRIKFKGRLGLELTVEQGKTATLVAMMQALGMVRQGLGSLDAVCQWIQLTVYCATGPDFSAHAAVPTTAAHLLTELYGAAGKCTHTVIGVSSLPERAGVMLGMVGELR